MTNIDIFLNATARLKKADGKIVGTGFLVTEKYILTCAHVVNQTLNKEKDANEEPSETIYLDFPFTGKPDVETLKSKVVFWLAMDENEVKKTGIKGAFDIALLELERPISNIEPVLLLGKYDEGNEFRTLGFPQNFDQGKPARGRIVLPQANGLVQLEGWKTDPAFIVEGFSGAPVIDIKLAGVVGMVVGSHEGIASLVSLMIPSTVLLKVCPQLQAVGFKCPYKGLSAFLEKDKPYFFGRKKVIEELVETIKHKPLLALMGNSGSGKSSVVFAGVLPQLREENWLIASCRPKADPFYQLAYALVKHVKDNFTDQLTEAEAIAEKLKKNELKLSRIIQSILNEKDRPLIMVIDQFEEVFTLNTDKEQQYNFLNQITQLIKEDIQQFRLMLTIRSDFMSYALGHDEFGKVLNQAISTLTAMTRKELFEAIVEPAKRQGVSLEEGLADTILDDVLTSKNEKDLAGRLPLLEFALTLLWEKQERPSLTHEAYQAIGKVEGALARHAQEVFGKFKLKEQEQLKHIFTQLVRPGEGTEDTRQVSTKELVGEENWPLVTELANERLVTTYSAEDTQQEAVEVIHEALIRSWQQLKEWVDADRDFRIWQNRVRPTVEEWQESSQDWNYAA